MSDRFGPSDDPAFDAAIRGFLERRAERVARTARPIGQLLPRVVRESRRHAGRRIGGAVALAVGLVAVVLAGLAMTAGSGRGPQPSATPFATPNVWAALGRPLHLPSVAAGETCPVTRERSVAPEVTALTGNGPVYPLEAVSDGTVFYNRTSSTGRQGTEVTWVAAPSFRGPVLVRGARLDGTGGLQFGEGSPELRLAPEDGLWPLGPAGWFAFGTDLTNIGSPGCYAYQLDGLGFSTVIVFEARPVADLLAHLRRPLQFPSVARGGSCPTAQLHTVVDWFAPALGAGPVYAAGYSATGVLSWGPTSPQGGWVDTKELWLSDPQTVGPIVVRGRQLDGSNEVRFGPGSDPPAELDLSGSEVGVANQSPGWRTFVTDVRFRAAGCYAYQVDTVRGSEVIVFRAQP